MGIAIPPLMESLGAATMAAFVARQCSLGRTSSALLDLRVFGSYNFTVYLLLFAILMLVLLGTITVLLIYVQNVLGLGTLEKGLLLVRGRPWTNIADAREVPVVIRGGHVVVDKQTSRTLN